MKCTAIHRCPFTDLHTYKAVYSSIKLRRQNTQATKLSYQLIDRTQTKASAEPRFQSSSLSHENEARLQRRHIAYLSYMAAHTKPHRSARSLAVRPAGEWWKSICRKNPSLISCSESDRLITRLLSGIYLSPSDLHAVTNKASFN